MTNEQTQIALLELGFDYLVDLVNYLDEMDSSLMVAMGLAAKSNNLRLTSLADVVNKALDNSRFRSLAIALVITTPEGRHHINSTLHDGDACVTVPLLNRYYDFAKSRGLYDEAKNAERPLPSGEGESSRLH